MTRARDLAAFVSNADGDIKFDTDTLFIDSSANSVGIGTSTPTAYGNGQTTLVVEDSSNPAIAISDTGQTRDWFLVALGDGLGIRYADGGGSGSASNVTESTFFKNDGSVGIGTSSPNGNLDITGSGNTDVYINTGNNSGDNSRIFFGDTADIDVGYLAYDHGTNKMVFGVNAGNRMFIDSSGDVHIADNANGPDAALHIEKTTPQLRLQLNGNSGYNTIESGGSNELIIGRSGTEQLRVLSGGGLTFNGDTAAANALDDYEEGTWTPSLTFNSGNTGLSFTVQSGYYTKIGRHVFCTFYLQLSSKGSSTGNARLVNFPFTTNTAAGSRGGGSFTYFHATSVPGNFGQFMLLVESGQTEASLRYYNTSSAGMTELSSSHFTSNTTFFGQFNFMV